MTSTDVAIVGGGIAGLAAAWELAAGTPSQQVTVLEASSRLGGKIETSSFAGIDLDAGPDAFLARVPAAAQLAREVGLGDELVAPGTGQAWLWARGRLRRLPTGLVLGVPVDMRALARSGVLPPAAVARAALDPVLPGQPLPAGDDESVGRLVRRRMGRAVQLDLVDPLLGGINAGHSDDLSAEVAAPQLLAAARRDASLVKALRAAGTGGTASGAVTENALAPNRYRIGANTNAGGGGPVFLTVRGGLSRLVDALAAGLTARGASVRTGETVTGLTRDADGWCLRLSSGEALTARAVVLACPAPELLRGVSQAAAAELGAIEWASVAMVTLAYAAEGAPQWEGSGFLVPRRERRFVTAGSWVGQKWPHLDVPGLLIVRASAGRVDDDRIAALDDDELASAVHADLSMAMGLAAPPVERRVTRWTAAFPQYAVGHLARVARAEQRLVDDAPGVVLAGAALRGVGIATCITGGRGAAQRLRAFLHEVRAR